MDLISAIRELREEKKRLDKAIAALQRKMEASSRAGRARATAASARRGRKSMSPEERKRVAERMARYWAERRAAKALENGDAQAQHAPE